MKFCRYCAGKQMIPKITIPLPNGKAITIAQCDQCQRIAQDDEP